MTNHIELVRIYEFGENQFGFLVHRKRYSENYSLRKKKEFDSVLL